MMDGHEKFLIALSKVTRVRVEACRSFMLDMEDYIEFIARHHDASFFKVAVKVLQASAKTAHFDKMIRMGLTPDDDAKIRACVPSRTVGLPGCNSSALVENAEPIRLLKQDPSKEVISAEELDAMFK